jgi:uridylate kinase
MESIPRFRRILLKLSGEALMGSQPFGIEPAVNLDFVNGEEVWVYGVNLTYAW